jgi:hypothetical protein
MTKKKQSAETAVRDIRRRSRRKFSPEEKSLAQRAELPGFRVAGAWRFQRGDIDHWITAQKQSATRARAAYGRLSLRFPGDWS